MKIDFPIGMPPYEEYEVDVHVYAFPLANSDKVVYGWLVNHSEYRKENAVAEGWLDTIELEQTNIIFDNEDTLTKIYAPRKFSQGLNDTDRNQYEVSDITNFR